MQSVRKRLIYQSCQLGAVKRIASSQVHFVHSSASYKDYNNNNKRKFSSSVKSTTTSNSKKNYLYVSLFAASAVGGLAYYYLTKDNKKCNRINNTFAIAYCESTTKAPPDVSFVNKLDRWHHAIKHGWKGKNPNASGLFYKETYDVIGAKTKTQENGEEEEEVEENQNDQKTSQKKPNGKFLVAKCEGKDPPDVSFVNKLDRIHFAIKHGWKGKNPNASGLYYEETNDVIGAKTKREHPVERVEHKKAEPTPKPAQVSSPPPAPVVATKPIAPVVPPPKPVVATPPVKAAAVSSEKLKNLPSYIPYLIVGGGPAGISAALAIRASDPTSRILIVSNEAHIPYLRPALSKEVWRRTKKRQDALLNPSGDMSSHSWLYFEPESFFIPVETLESCELGGVGLLRNSSVVKLNPHAREVELSSGNVIKYGQCCVSTGGRPRQLKELHHCSKTSKDLYSAQRISYFRSLDDYKKLRELAEKLDKTQGKIVIVGGGFLGSELATSLSEVRSKDSNMNVVHIFQEEAPLSRVLPPYLAEHTREYLKKKGVIVKSRKQAVSVGLTNAKDDVQNGSLELILKGVGKDETETEENVSHVVVVIGIEPNTDLAETAPELELDSKLGGILVNTEMEAVKGVFVAGDVSSFYDPLLGRRRVEHQNHAEESGRIAGRNMAASMISEKSTKSAEEENLVTILSRASYHYQSSLWSYLGPELMWDAVGLCDPNGLATHAFFSTSSLNEEEKNEEFKKFDRPGVVFYTDSRKRIKGILLWNLPEDLYRDEEKYAPSRLNLARKILSDGKTFSNEAELAAVASNFDLDGSVDLIYQRMLKAAKKDADEQKKEGVKS